MSTDTDPTIDDETPSAEPEVTESVEPAPPTPIGAAVHPFRKAAESRRAALEPEVKPRSTAKFHARRSLVPTGTRTRPAPKVRAETDQRRVDLVDPDRAVPAGPEFEGEIIEGQA